MSACRSSGRVLSLASARGLSVVFIFWCVRRGGRRRPLQCGMQSAECGVWPQKGTKVHKKQNRGIRGVEDRNQALNKLNGLNGLNEENGTGNSVAGREHFGVLQCGEGWRSLLCPF